MPRVGFEPTISAGERPKTYALDRAATGTGNTNQIAIVKQSFSFTDRVIALWKDYHHSKVLGEV